VVTAVLIESNGSNIASDSATVTVSGDDSSFLEGIDPKLIEADPDAGYNYPYFLYAPNRYSGQTTPILVEPVNTGRPSNNLEDHITSGRDTVQSGLGRSIADSVEAPFVVPVFPRPAGDPVDATHYVHQLDDTTMSISEGPLERVDLQLLKMVEDAQSRLSERDYPVDDGIMLNGFSASGNFVDRFAVLHPDRVVSVTAGGLNGMAILPLEEAEGQELPYHVGVSNLDELVGSTLNKDALDEVNQFLYMGADDTNDTIPYDDAWTDEDMRQLALDVYGEDMILERFPRCQRAYQEAGIEAQFRVYSDTGHSPAPARDDIIEVHRRTIRGESVADLGETITNEVVISASSSQPTVGESVEFSGTETSLTGSTVSNYLWEFGSGDSAVGESVTYSYDSPGEKTVTLTVVTDDGMEFEQTQSVRVTESGETGDESTPSAEEGTETTPNPSETLSPTETGEPDETTGTEAADTTTEETPGGSGPGFGIVGTLAGVGGAARLLQGRLSDTENSKKSRD
jgi:hypothetical protein